MESHADTNPAPFLGKDEETRKLLETTREKSYTKDDLSNITQDIKSGDKLKHLSGVVALRKLLLSGELSIQQVINEGLLFPLPTFLEDEGQPDLQYETAWVLWKVTSGNLEEITVVIHMGITTQLLGLLKSSHEEIVDQAIRVIGNIAKVSVQSRDFILGSQGAKLIVEALKKIKQEKFLENGTQVLSSFCRVEPFPEYESIKDVVPFFCSLLESSNQKILSEAASGLSYISDPPKDDELEETIIPMSAVPILLKHLEHSNVRVVEPCLRIIGNIVAGTHEQTKMLIKFPDLMPKLFKFIEHEDENIRKEACWILSNIVADEEKNFDSVLGDPVNIKKIINISLNDTLEVRKRAIWVLTNSLTMAKESQIIKLFQNGILDCFVKLLELTDIQSLELIVEGIHVFLKRGREIADETEKEDQFLSYFENLGGLAKVKVLQNHEDSIISKQAKRILDIHFGEEEAV